MGVGKLYGVLPDVAVLVIGQTVLTLDGVTSGIPHVVAGK